MRTFDCLLDTFFSKHLSGSSLSLLQQWTCILCSKKLWMLPASGQISACCILLEIKINQCTIELPTSARAVPAHRAVGGELCRVQPHSAVPGQELWKPGGETSQAQTFMASRVSVSFPCPLQRWIDQECEPFGRAAEGKSKYTLLLWWLSRLLHRFVCSPYAGFRTVRN